jgi:hypothetical protein
VFNSLNLKEKLTPAMKSFASGSIRKGVRLLLGNKDLQAKAIQGVKDAVKIEVSNTLSRNAQIFKKPTIDNMKNFKMEEISECMKDSAPLTWNTLTAISEGKQTGDMIKTVTSACILLNARNKQLNHFQHIVSVALYNNQLQREGINILHKLGLCVSHSTLQRTLNEAKSITDTVMQKVKMDVEENALYPSQGAIIHDHAYHMHTAHISDHAYQTAPQSLNTTLSPGYRFNMDNLDFYIRVRDMTQGHQNQSKHYVQLLAVKDRVNCEGLGDSQPIGDLTQLENHQFLPNASDNNSLREDFIHVVSLILIENLTSFKVFEGIYDVGFDHQYSHVMKEKSIVVKTKILMFYFCLAVLAAV